MQCPKCQFENQDSAVECPKCGIVFAKYRRSQEPVEVAEDEPQGKNELWFRVFALPGALILARALVGAAPGQVRLLTMWVHECGHALTAWLCGFAATPSAFVTQ